MFLQLYELVIEKSYTCVKKYVWGMKTFKIILEDREVNVVIDSCFCICSFCENQLSLKRYPVLHVPHPVTNY